MGASGPGDAIRAEHRRLRTFDLSTFDGFTGNAALLYLGTRTISWSRCGARNGAFEFSVPYWAGFLYSLTPAVGRAETRFGGRRLSASQIGGNRLDRNALWRTATVVPLPSMCPASICQRSNVYCCYRCLGAVNEFCVGVRLRQSRTPEAGRLPVINRAIRRIDFFW